MQQVSIRAWACCQEWPVLAAGNVFLVQQLRGISLVCGTGKRLTNDHVVYQLIRCGAAL